MLSEHNYLIHLKLVLRKILQNKKYFCIVILVAGCVTFLNSDWRPDLYFLTLEKFEDISCYNSHLNDALPAIEEDFTPPVKSIYFHETSCGGWLNSRQGCSVESAAKMHPDWQIYVFFTRPVQKEILNRGSAKVLTKYNNVKFLRLHLIDYAKGTPLQDFVSNGGLNKTRWRISHTSDALRFLSLFKWGGVYLDLDLLVVKSFDILGPNWAAREDAETVAAGALAFSSNSLGRKVAHSAIMDFKKNFRGDDRTYNSNGVITRVLKKMCTETVANMNKKTCMGFEVYDSELFYPIRYENRREQRVWDPFTYQMRNRDTTFFAVKNICPEVFNLYGCHFGI